MIKRKEELGLKKANMNYSFVILHIT